MTGVETIGYRGLSLPGTSALSLTLDDLRREEHKVDKKKSRLKAIIATMVVIAVAVAVVVGCVVGFSNAAPSTKAIKGFSLNDTLFGTYSAAGFNGTWLSGTEVMYSDEAGDLVIRDLALDTVSVIVTGEKLTELKAVIQWLSSDKQYLLYGYDYEKVWRHTFRAKFSVLKISDLSVHPLTVTGGEDILNYATFAPSGNGIAFVYRNNIYYKPSPEGLNMQITSDGSTEVFNGVPDWVYEEEVLSSDNALWFSPDGKKIAFATFRDQNVATFEFPYYGNPGSLEWQYTKQVPIKYPKPGTSNPYVSFTVFNLESAVRRVDGGYRRGYLRFTLQPPPQLQRIDHIFTSVAWKNSNEVMIVWMNRVQNDSYYTSYNADTGFPTVAYRYSEPNGWLDSFTPPQLSADGNQFLLVHPVTVQADGNFSTGDYNHVVLFTAVGDAWTKTSLTYGHFVIDSVSAWDQTRGKVYAIGTEPDLPSVRRLYEADIATRTFKCITCNQSCRWGSVSFSKGASHYSYGCSSMNVPATVKIMRSEDHTAIMTWEDNAELRASLELLDLPKFEDRRIPVGPAELGLRANVRMMMPQTYDPSNPSAKKYPVLVYVYGGPNSQQITDRYSIGWGHHLVSRDVIYALIDGRGSGYQGNTNLFQINRRMGTVEVEDQIAVMKELKKEAFVDGTKAAIWGWSYGGFATAASMARDVGTTEKPAAFRCGMSVAPVTNWIYYDSIYTERYMGLPTPDDNEFGYNNTDLTRIVENFRHKKFFLLHGTADDNVHYQQSMMLSKALENVDILFRAQSYPDQDHGIVTYKTHLYHSLTAFLMQDCFNLESNEIS